MTSSGGIQDMRRSPPSIKPIHIRKFAWKWTQCCECKYEFRFEHMCHVETGPYLGGVGVTHIMCIDCFEKTNHTPTIPNRIVPPSRRKVSASI